MKKPVKKELTTRHYSSIKGWNEACKVWELYHNWKVKKLGKRVEETDKENEVLREQNLEAIKVIEELKVEIKNIRKCL